MRSPDAAAGRPAGARATPDLVQILSNDAPFRDGISKHLQTLGRFTTACHDDDTVVVRRLATTPRYLAALVVGASTPSAQDAEICAAFRLHGATLPILLAGGQSFEPWPAIRHAVMLGDRPGKSDTNGRVQACLKDRFHTLAYGNACFAIAGHIYCAGPKKLIPDDGGKAVRLTPTEAALLETLWLNRGKTIAGPVLTHRIWGRACAETQRALKSHIYNLRQKIEQDSALRGRVLLTQSSGYRLVPEGLRF